MQSLDVISINLWQIIISLLNLLILCLIIKKFLYKPVKNMLSKREAELNEMYNTANDSIKRAESDEAYWKEKRESAQAEAEEIIEEATSSAKMRGEKIVAEAKDKAEGILKRAQNDAELEMEKAQDTIKREIIDVSSALAEKMLGREINIEDHRNMIDSVIEDIK
ncbi:MAG: F0F1 ATP synthase subunit B [Clostridia bacterium]|nr:F0F1 ATP synthase subunit B [Clostridia bacterium]